MSFIMKKEKWIKVKNWIETTILVFLSVVVVTGAIEVMKSASDISDTPKTIYIMSCTYHEGNDLFTGWYRVETHPVTLESQDDYNWTLRDNNNFILTVNKEQCKITPYGIQSINKTRD